MASPSSDYILSKIILPGYGFHVVGKIMRHYPRIILESLSHAGIHVEKGLFRKLMWPGAAYLNQQIVLTGGYDGDSRTNRAEV